MYIGPEIYIFSCAYMYMYVYHISYIYNTYYSTYHIYIYEYACVHTRTNLRAMTQGISYI